MSPATVQIQSSRGTTGILVLAFDTQTHTPPRPRPPATPQACAASLKLSWQENWVESYAVCCVTFQDQLFSLGIIAWRFIMLFKILSEITRKNEMTGQHPWCPKRSTVSRSVTHFHHMLPPCVSHPQPAASEGMEPVWRCCVWEGACAGCQCASCSPTWSHPAWVRAPSEPQFPCCQKGIISIPTQVFKKLQVSFA